MSQAPSLTDDRFTLRAAPENNQSLLDGPTGSPLEVEKKYGAETFGYALAENSFFFGALFGEYNYLFNSYKADKNFNPEPLVNLFPQEYRPWRSELMSAKSFQHFDDIAGRATKIIERQKALKEDPYGGFYSLVAGILDLPAVVIPPFIAYHAPTMAAALARSAVVNTAYGVGSQTLMGIRNPTMTQEEKIGAIALSAALSPIDALTNPVNKAASTAAGYVKKTAETVAGAADVAGDAFVATKAKVGQAAEVLKRAGPIFSAVSPLFNPFSKAQPNGASGTAAAAKSSINNIAKSIDAVDDGIRASGEAVSEAVTSLNGDLPTFFQELDNALKSVPDFVEFGKKNDYQFNELHPLIVEARDIHKSLLVAIDAPDPDGMVYHAGSTMKIDDLIAKYEKAMSDIADEVKAAIKQDENVKLPYETTPLDDMGNPIRAVADEAEAAKTPVADAGPASVVRQVEKDLSAPRQTLDATAPTATAKEPLLSAGPVTARAADEGAATGGTGKSVKDSNIFEKVEGENPQTTAKNEGSPLNQIREKYGIDHVASVLVNSKEDLLKHVVNPDLRRAIELLPDFMFNRLRFGVFSHSRMADGSAGMYLQATAKDMVDEIAVALEFAKKKPGIGTTITTFFHEMGHRFIMRFATDAEMQTMINAWKNAGGGNPGWGSPFNEWFADTFAKSMTKRFDKAGTAKPKAPDEPKFDGLLGRARQFFADLTSSLGLTRKSPDAVMDEFIDTLTAAGRGEGRTADELSQSPFAKYFKDSEASKVVREATEPSTVRRTGDTAEIVFPERIAPAYGAEKFRFTAMQRILQKGSEAAFDMAMNIFSHSALLKKNYGSYVNPEAASTSMKFRLDDLAQTIEDVFVTGYLAYRGKPTESPILEMFKTRTTDFVNKIGGLPPESRGNHLTPTEYGKAVWSRALSGKDLGNDAINGAGDKLRAFYDKYGKELVDAGMLSPESLQPRVWVTKTLGIIKEHYVNRVWNLPHIKDNEAAFKQRVAQWGAEIGVDYGPKEIQAIFDSVTQNNPFRPIDLEHIGGANALKNRSFSASSEFFKDFLVDDAEALVRNYVEKVGPEIELTKRFGSVTMEMIRPTIFKEYARLIADAFPDNPALARDAKEAFYGFLDQLEAAKMKASQMYADELAASKNPDIPLSIEQVNEIREVYNSLEASAMAGLKTDMEKLGLGKIHKSILNEIDDLLALRDLFTGRFMQSDDPFSVAPTFVRTAKQFTVLTTLTGFVSALPDFGAIILKEGFAKTFAPLFYGLTENISSLKLAAKEADMVGAAAELILSSRAMDMSQLTDIYGRHRGWQRGLDNLTTMGFTVNLTNQATFLARRLSGIVIQTRILDTIETLAKGADISEYEKALLRRYGISDGDIQAIYAQSKHWQTLGPNRMANTDLWTDQKAARAFKRALRESIDDTIIAPGKQDMPNWMSTEFGSLIGMYKGFAFAATNRILIPALQRNDIRTLAGGAALIGIGMMVDDLHQMRNDDKRQFTLMEKIGRGFDRAGLGGIYTEAFKFGDAMVDGSDRAKVNAVLGPAFSQMARAMDVAIDVTEGDWTNRTAQNVRKLIPGTNYTVTDPVFDAFQGAISPAPAEAAYKIMDQKTKGKIAKDPDIPAQKDSIAKAGDVSEAYGSGLEPFISGKAKMNIPEIPELPRTRSEFIKKYLDEKMANATLREPDSMLSWHINVQSKIIKRSALAALGFDPRTMVVMPKDIQYGDAAGFYASDGKKDVMAVNASDLNVAIHESVHRGIEIMEKSGVKIPKDVDEERLVRFIMRDVLKIKEKGIPDDLVIQPSEVPDLRKAFEKLESAAAKKIAKDRPGGPR